MLFTSVATRTFTIFVETALGQTFSVVATPVKGEGRVYRLMSAEPPSRPETRKWETAQAYEKLLISLNRAVLTGDIPDGYGEVKPLSDGIRLPVVFLLPPEAWRATNCVPIVMSCVMPIPGGWRCGSRTSGSPGCVP
ncbi:conjugal transfer protein TraK [Citrobacter freundii]|nr:conjugal transfer protein TraK [Citrobacter freundii]